MCDILSSAARACAGFAHSSPYAGVVQLLADGTETQLTPWLVDEEAVSPYLSGATAAVVIRHV